MKTFKEYLEEISKKTYVSAIGKADDAGKHGTVDKLVSRAGREKGEKFGKDMEQVAYGMKKHGRSMAKRTNNDPLKSRKVGVTKQGKANKKDVENLKGQMKDNIHNMRVDAFRSGKADPSARKMPISKRVRDAYKSIYGLTK